MLPQECIQLEKFKKSKTNYRGSSYTMLKSFLCFVKKIPLVVGFDIGKIAGLVEVESLRASNT